MQHLHAQSVVVITLESKEKERKKDYASSKKAPNFVDWVFLACFAGIT